MKYEELTKLEQHQVRNNPRLMSAYIQLFKEMFGYEPNCAGCTFNSDWQKFIANSENQLKSQISNQKQMEKSFKLFDELKIYTYRKTLENGVEVPVRTYGYAMTEEFAQSYLTEGTDEQIRERRKEFKKLPKNELPQEESTDKQEQKDLSEMTFNELKEFALKNELPQEDWGKIKKKDELLAYLEANIKSL